MVINMKTSLSKASTWLTVPHLPFHSFPTSSLWFLIQCISSQIRCSFVLHLNFFSQSFSLQRCLSGSSVFKGHVRGEEEHVGVILVIAEVYQVSLCIAHRPGVVLADSSPVTESRLQS